MDQVQTGRLSITIVGRDSQAEQAWVPRVEEAFSRFLPVQVNAASNCRDSSEHGAVVLIDGMDCGGKHTPEIEQALSRVHRRGRAVFLILPARLVNGAVLERCESLEQGEVDDALLFPFQPVEVMGRIRQFQQLQMWEEVNRLNLSFASLIEQLREDLSLTERMQKARLNARFPEVKGFAIEQRTLVGWKSGDHVDLAESKDGQQLSIVMSDSSSSRLSSAVLSILMRVAVKLSTDEARSSFETVRKIHQEVSLVLGEKDRFSVFYGLISRKDYRLRYVNYGTSRLFLARKGQGFQELPFQGAPITRDSGFPPVGEHLGGALPSRPVSAEQEVELCPEDRLVWVSDGFVESLGSPTEVVRVLDAWRDRDATDLLNELSFRVKSALASEDDLPAQDCTALLFDVADKLIRLAR